MQAFRYDAGNVKECYLTEEGYIRGVAKVTRTGIFNYMNSDGSIRRELRLPEHVLHDDSLNSMKMIPITNGHPTVKLVDSENARELVIGMTGEDISQDGNYIKTNFVITDAAGVKAVKEMGRKELSLGYTVDLLESPGVYEGENYDYIQSNIKYNHLAIVDSARAGGEARIVLDGLEAIEIIGEVNMTKRKIKIDEVDYMVDPQLADYIDDITDRESDRDKEIKRLKDDVKNLTDERERVNAELERVRTELERVMNEKDVMSAENDSMKEKMSTNNDSANINRAVKERLSLYTAMSKANPDQNIDRLDSMSNIEIKKLIINSHKKSISLDSKSSTYIDAMFDLVMAEADKNVNVSNLRQMKQDEAINSADPAAAYIKMKAKLQNASSLKK